MFYRTYFPDDVDISVPYVAPLNQSLEDGRHEPFISNKVSTPENRKRVENFQLEVLKRKSRLLPMFEKYCSDKGYTFRIPIAEVYDLSLIHISSLMFALGLSRNKSRGV